MQGRPMISRRLTSRVPTPDGVWVLWTCHGRDDVARVHDISTSGMFLETNVRMTVGWEIGLHFLVQEGQIRANAGVCHLEDQRGIGLKFTAVKTEDRPRLEALIERFRNPSSSNGANGR